MRRVAIVVLLLSGLALSARAQTVGEERTQPLPPDPARGRVTPTGAVPTGAADLTPGEKAPDFKLDSSLGGTVSRADLQGHWFVLVFAASRTSVAPVGAVQDSIEALDVRPLGVCSDGVGALVKLAAKTHLRLPVLSDPTGEISQLFGMYDDENGAIRPGLVLVDPQGIVRMVLQGPPLHASDVLAMVRHVLRGA